MDVSAEQLICNVAERLMDDIKSIKFIPWPPRVKELEDEEELSHLMVQLLSSLRGKNMVDLSPSKLFLSHLSHHTVSHQATHHYRHRHPSRDDSQQGVCRLLLQARHRDQLPERAFPA